MGQFSEFCLRAKVIAVELTGLLVFLGVLGAVLWWEWSHIVRFVGKQWPREPK